MSDEAEPDKMTLTVIVRLPCRRQGKSSQREHEQAMQRRRKVADLFDAMGQALKRKVGEKLMNPHLIALAESIVADRWLQNGEDPIVLDRGLSEIKTVSFAGFARNVPRWSIL
jgi:hypothetical protein